MPRLPRGRATQITSQLSRNHYSKMVDNVKEIWESVTEISPAKKAAITHVTKNSAGQSLIGVEVMWSSLNRAASERTCNLNHYLIQDGKTISHSQTAAATWLLRQTSESGEVTACVMTSGKDKEGEYVMVMRKDGCMTTIDLKAADKHGKVYADEEFGCLEWSPDESTLVYVAEKKQPKPTSFFAPVKNGGEDGRGHEYLHRDDWGEQMTGKHTSVVCFLNVKTKEVSVHELPAHLCPSQMVWTADGTGVFGVAVETQPFRLGVVYCQNRVSKLFHMDLNGNFSVITEGQSHIHYPRVSPDGKKIAFIRSEVGGPHAKCSQLCVLSWPPKQERTVVDVVGRKKEIRNDQLFFGIYAYAGRPRRCWLSDSERLIISTLSHARVVPYVVDTSDGSLTQLPCIGSHEVLDVFSDYLLVNFSTLSHPNQILMGRVPGRGQEDCIEMHPVTPARDVPNVSGLEYSVTEFVNDTPHPNPKYSDVPISILYCGPKTNTTGSPKRPLICWPHGGPHSANCNIYSNAVTFFVSLGYSVMFVNYRGSLGYGQEGVDSLPGHCGLTDVDDVHKATVNCLKRFSDILDESQVFLFGGSHGGFLVTHLAAQYPDFYKAVSARNPVTDLSTMAEASDIPDWVFVEAGYKYEHGKVPDGAMLTKMLEMSPISQIDNIKAPILLLVGKNDARVPPSQGWNFHRLLLARGVETELHMYNDCHPLSKADVEDDTLIHTALWLEKHRTKNTGKQ